MKINSYVFTALFLSLASLPVNVFAANDPSQTDKYCTELAQKVVNCIFDDDISTFSPTNVKQCKGFPTIYNVYITTNQGKTYIATQKKFEQLMKNLTESKKKDFYKFEVFDKKNKKYRTQIQNTQQNELLNEAKSTCMKLWGISSNTTKSSAQKAGNTKQQTTTQPQVVKSEVATLPKNAITNSDPVYYNDDTNVYTPQEAKMTMTAGDESAYKKAGYDPEAASKQNQADKKRAAANAKYAETLRNPDSWTTVEANEPMIPTSTNTVSNTDGMDFAAASRQEINKNADFMTEPLNETPHETIDSLATPTVSATQAVKPGEIEIKTPTIKRPSKADLKKQSNAAKKELCQDRNGRWDGVNCWCDINAKTMDLSDETTCPTSKAQKVCEQKEKGTWVEKGDKSTCICPKQNEGYFWNRDIQKCILEDFDETDDLTDDSGCLDGYELSKDKKSCVPTKNSQKAIDAIHNSATKLKIGDVVKYDLSVKDVQGVKKELTSWNKACMYEIKKINANAVAFIYDEENKGKITRFCFIESCGDNNLMVSEDKKSCVPVKNKNDNCPAGTKKVNGTCEYIERGPWPDNANACHNGTFVYFNDLTGTPKDKQEESFTAWKTGCESLKECKHASEMEWNKTYHNDNDDSDSWGCIPKTCLSDYPIKTNSGCSASDEPTENQGSDKGFIKLVAKITDAFNTLVSEKKTEYCATKQPAIPDENQGTEPSETEPESD